MKEGVEIHPALFLLAVVLTNIQAILWRGALVIRSVFSPPYRGNEANLCRLCGGGLGQPNIGRVLIWRACLKCQRYQYGEIYSGGRE